MNAGLLNIFDPSSDRNRNVGYLRELLNESITNKTRLEAEIKVWDANVGSPSELSDNEAKRYEAMNNARDSLDKLIDFISGIKL